MRAADPPSAEAQVEAVVVERREVADGVVELTLESATGRLGDWEAGSHVDVRLGDELVRQYSLCGPREEQGRWRIAVLREPGSRGGSRHVHDHLHPGSAVTLRGPRNNFRLLPAEGYLFVAGGVGITPILAMVREAESAGTPWRLLYGGRTAQSMAFVPELLALAGDRPERVQIRPQDEFGLLDLDAFVHGIGQRELVYCCGPEALIGSMESRAAGWPDATLQTERFSARADLLEAPTGEFVVELARTGTSLPIAADQSILDALQEAGVDIDSSCHEGICGSCETAVLAGSVDHRDTLLTEFERAANDVMFVCVSRCRGDRLVLDL